MEIFQVGGCVRDEFLGVPSKDIDFTCVLSASDFYIRDGIFANSPFMVMVTHLESMGFKIFLETPEFLTVRARFPGKGYTVEHEMLNYPYDKYKGLTADFVLARKESDYTDGRRPDRVVPGTLMDDLARRDFKMNAIAKAVDGSIIDPFGGMEDIANRIISAVGDPLERLTEDALRAVRALRFSVVKGFQIAPSLAYAMQLEVVLDSIRNNISDERIQQELSKMFRHDTSKSLKVLWGYPRLTEAMLSGGVHLDATMKTKGFR